MDVPVGLHCPGCGQPPFAVMGGGTQAWCGNVTGCNVIIWNPAKTMDEMLDDLKQVDLSGWA